jgi:phosphoglycerol transferase MdoB-like AlkP superfamily enzyme
MKQRLIILFLIFVSWVLIFELARIFFVIYNHNLLAPLSITDTFLIFAYGIRMDLAMAGYFSLLPGLVLAIFFFKGGRFIWTILFYYTAIILFITCIIVVVDMELYAHWGFRMDATPLLYISREATAAIPYLTSILLIVFCILLFSVILYCYKKYFKKRITNLSQSSWEILPTLVIATALFIVPIRGGFGVAPMNTGFVYFHERVLFANHAAINVVWNFLDAVKDINKNKYPDNYFDKEKTNQRFKALFPPLGKTRQLISNDTPNVIIIVMESFTYRFIEPLGGLPGIAPRFNALAKEGILFDNFYASGDRTDKGIVAILNGYPAQPVTSIIKEPKKSASLPYLNKIFKHNGYRSAFTYGCNINFANFKSFLIQGDFDHLTHSLDFPKEFNTSKWGVHDQYVFDRFYDEIEKTPQPFFKVMMTGSSHEPFDVPMPTVIKGKDDVHLFLNSAFYADSCLGVFIDNAKKQPWWRNTLVVITADHGHPMPDFLQVNDPLKFKIPMLWLGGALNVQDTVVHTMASQTDISNTILAQVHKFNDQFTFSHDMLNETYQPVAIFAYNNGFGLLRPGKILVFDNATSKYVREEGQVLTTDQEDGKAYMQKLYWDFNSR